MASALRLRAGLAQRSEASAAQVAAAGTPDELLQANVQCLRSLTVLAGKADPEGTALIVKQAAEAIAVSVAEMTTLINRIAEMNEARRARP